MKLVWLDLETTGLNPAECVVLEVAYGVSALEDPFNLTERGSFTLHHIRREGDGTDPFVVDMHTKNGLWVECQESTLTMRDVEAALLLVVPDIKEWEDKPTLAGNCVGFDHGFLKRYAPSLAARFHYRYYDVSSVKLFCRSLGMPKLPSGEAHRAAADVTESVKHADKCAEWCRGSGYPAMVPTSLAG
jgi:oligoribonuclease